MSSLKILVVDRGENQKAVSNDHTLIFRLSAKIEDQFIDLEDYNYVFIHLTYGFAEEAISHWVESGRGSKLIGFSGGPVSGEKQYGHFYLPLMGSLASEEAFLRLNWGAVPKDFSGTSKDLIRLLLPPSVEVTTALAILCQGYLALYAEYDSDRKRWGPDGIVPALVQMGWTTLNENEKLVLAADDLKLKRQEVANASWWLDVFGLIPEDSRLVDGSKWNVFLELLEGEWEGDIPEELKHLLDLLVDEYKLSGVVDDPVVVARAYCAIAKKLGGKPCKASPVT